MRRLIIALLALLCAAPIHAQNRNEDKTIAAKTDGLQKVDGYIPLYWDAGAGKMLMEISMFNTELLYQVSLPAGDRSNPRRACAGALGRAPAGCFLRGGRDGLR